MTLLELGAAANAECERRHGNRVYFSLAPLAVVEHTGGILPAGTRAVSVSVPAGAGATTGEAEIRAIAQARLHLPAVDHIAADWTLLTPYVAQVALRFGASLLTGIPPGTPRAEVVRLITQAGREPFECNAAFESHAAVWESALPVLHS